MENLSPYDETTPWEIRKQILDYQTTAYMSDIERAAYFGLPEGCRMRENAKIIAPQNLIMGRNCWIGEGAILDASGHLSIGDNVSIGLSVFVWTHDSHKVNITGENTKENSFKIKRKPTTIGDHCFIAGPSVIMPGVNIGHRCIVAPMSVVYEDLPDGSIYRPYKEFVTEHKNRHQLLDRIQGLENEIQELKKLLFPTQ